MCPETSHQRCCKFALVQSWAAITAVSSLKLTWQAPLKIGIWTFPIHFQVRQVCLFQGGIDYPLHNKLHNLPTIPSTRHGFPNLRDCVSGRESITGWFVETCSRAPQRLEKAEMKWAALATATVALLSDGGAALKYAATGTWGTAQMWRM